MNRAGEGVSGGDDPLRADGEAPGPTRRPPLRADGGRLLVPVRVVPRSGRNDLTLEAGGLCARLTTPPVEGAANGALVALLAARLHMPRHAITLVRGATARHKLLAVESLTTDEFWRRLGL